MWSTLKIVAQISYVDADRSIFSIDVEVNTDDDPPASTKSTQMIYVVDTYVDANNLSLASTIVDTNELNIKKKIKNQKLN
jgi:hypothetical protein